ncbi:MAG: biotin/lipoyl-containing protein, partial [Gammaproteobacteria bacterium]
MSQYIFKMPDLGEGTVDAEIVAWHTKPGDEVTEDQLIVEVMTDKAAVEVPAPVSGRVISITGAPGEKVAVGSPLIVFELEDVPAVVAAAPVPRAPTAAAPALVARSGRVMASPANRRRAREAGIDLSTVAGSGPGGRIVRGDLESAEDHSSPPAGAAHA